MNLQRLDLNLLVALDALLTERSITRAAEKLFLSPSATSGALARLRTYFGDELLTQIGRRMVPTPLGESLQEVVRDCLLHVQAAVETRPVFDPATSRRKFVLMMSDYVATVLMPPVLARLQGEAPGVSIELLSNAEMPWEAMTRGEVDFLVLPRNFIHDDHPAELLFEDDYVCVCWTGNKAIAEQISVAQCEELGHVVARIGNVRPPTIDALFLEHFGFKRRVEVVTMSFGSVPHLLIGTQRISFMHKRLADVYCGTLPLRWVPSPIPMPQLQEMVQWHKYRDRDPGRIWMTEVLRAAVR